MNVVPLQVQALQLQALLSEAGDDPVLKPQLAQRLDEVTKEIKESTKEPGKLLPRDTRVLPRAAVFLRGKSVEGSFGIRSSLAGEILLSYERMFVEQALHDEREAARAAGKQRRPRGAASPGLYLTGTPRGSFGLEFVPVEQEASPLLEVHAESLRRVAKAIESVASSDDETVGQAIAQIPSRVLQPIKSFFKTLSVHQAELRLALDKQKARIVQATQIARAAELLDRDVQQVTREVKGIFRGVTLDTGAFDIRDESGEIISGTVSDGMTDEDMEKLIGLTNRSCIASLQVTTISKVGGSSNVTYVLLDAAGVAG